MMSLPTCWRQALNSEVISMRDDKHYREGCRKMKLMGKSFTGKRENDEAESTYRDCNLCSTTPSTKENRDCASAMLHWLLPCRVGIWLVSHKWTFMNYDNALVLCGGRYGQLIECPSNTLWTTSLCTTGKMCFKPTTYIKAIGSVWVVPLLILSQSQ